MKRPLLTVTVLAGIAALGACGGDDGPEAGFETVDPYATDPAATTAPPTEMEPETIGTDTMGQRPATDTMMP